ncbi:ComEA family DNA-binding protein [Candidatus Microgenomates bacterium]|nr:ComEA family DNA-binding protein [Candidatus Microgenomates bacterium]
MWQEKLLTLWSANKLPLILSSIGLLLVLAGIFSMVKSENSKESGVILEEGVSIEASTSTSLSVKNKIVVDISGAVVSPGVYQLKSDARLQDGLIAAGGLSQSADREWIAKNLNLAVKLKDGSKIYIPRTGESVSQKTQSVGVSANQTFGASEGLINVNTASLSELDKLPGIGPVTAQKIIDNRPYSSVDELLSKKIVGSKVFSQIKEKIGVY